jgi:hypothetical protein
MATALQTRTLSTPSIYISGRLIAIVPNSLTIKFGGERNVRAMSAGGGSIQIVSGTNAEKMLSDLMFEIANTGENSDLVRYWASRANNGLAETVRVTELAMQYAFEEMFYVSEPELHFKADGNIKNEFKGRLIE